MLEIQNTYKHTIGQMLQKNFQFKCLNVNTMLFVGLDTFAIGHLFDLNPIYSIDSKIGWSIFVAWTLTKLHMKLGLHSIFFHEQNSLAYERNIVKKLTTIITNGYALALKRLGYLNDTAY
jgi:hypothetical protein